jgi:hypothetical protein
MTIKRSVLLYDGLRKTLPSFGTDTVSEQVEGTMSQLDRLTGLKNLRVRGLSAVSFAAHLKAAGINIIRAAAFLNRENEGEPALTAALSMLSCAVKERLQHVSANIRHWVRLWRLDLQVATF